MAFALAFASTPLLAVPVAGQDVELIAHRGESADAPENTLAAVKLAWERGVPSVEIDVHLTRDDSLAVIHDADTRRTTGVQRVVRESTLAELRALDAGRWKGARWADEPIPSLEDVLATVPENGRLFIEVKVGPEAIPAVARAIESSGKRPDQLAIISFQADAVAEAKRRLPEIDAFYLASFRQDSVTGRWTPGIDELIRTAREIGADGLDLSVRGPVYADFIRRVKDAGLGIYIWTVDDPAIAWSMILAGVEGITTNRAAAMERELAER